ncbi:hypothetical protein PPERSA_10117 [Pseudocohnilembus persalinus]|uniref:Tetratricopeptide repeat protein n=1 Tax=Pseudocohnilembus persalinus TaxID=266149 RepID=A0A0V0R9M4_PSEPJ|nr:hypothetical protein PPERSA_10117 [Pseudocohnilembus persalinus]|eukprot:KRX11185.1 hypothetical protein PPERSA_10117 [Pseudocohnilembus persalinus]
MSQENERMIEEIMFTCETLLQQKIQEIKTQQEDSESNNNSPNSNDNKKQMQIKDNHNSQQNIQNGDIQQNKDKGQQQNNLIDNQVQNMVNSKDEIKTWKHNLLSKLLQKEEESLFNIEKISDLKFKLNIEQYQIIANIKPTLSIQQQMLQVFQSYKIFKNTLFNYPSDETLDVKSKLYRSIMDKFQDINIRHYQEFSEVCLVEMGQNQIENSDLVLTTVDHFLSPEINKNLIIQQPQVENENNDNYSVFFIGEPEIYETDQNYFWREIFKEKQEIILTEQQKNQRIIEFEETQKLIKLNYCINKVKQTDNDSQIFIILDKNLPKILQLDHDFSHLQKYVEEVEKIEQIKQQYRQKDENKTHSNSQKQITPFFKNITIPLKDLFQNLEIYEEIQLKKQEFLKQYEFNSLFQSHNNNNNQKQNNSIITEINTQSNFYSSFNNKANYIIQNPEQFYYFYNIDFFFVQNWKYWVFPYQKNLAKNIQKDEKQSEQLNESLLAQKFSTDNFHNFYFSSSDSSFEQPDDSYINNNNKYLLQYDIKKTDYSDFVEEEQEEVVEEILNDLSKSPQNEIPKKITMKNIESKPFVYEEEMGFLGQQQSENQSSVSKNNQKANIAPQTPSNQNQNLQSQDSINSSTISQGISTLQQSVQNQKTKVNQNQQQQSQSNNSTNKVNQNPNTSQKSNQQQQQQKNAINQQNQHQNTQLLSNKQQDQKASQNKKKQEQSQKKPTDSHSKPNKETYTQNQQISQPQNKTNKDLQQNPKQAKNQGQTTQIQTSANTNNNNINNNQNNNNLNTNLNTKEKQQQQEKNLSSSQISQVSTNQNQVESKKQNKNKKRKKNKVNNNNNNNKEIEQEQQEQLKLQQEQLQQEEKNAALKLKNEVQSQTDLEQLGQWTQPLSQNKNQRKKQLKERKKVIEDLAAKQLEEAENLLQAKEQSKISVSNKNNSNKNVQQETNNKQKIDETQKENPVEKQGQKNKNKKKQNLKEQNQNTIQQNQNTQKNESLKEKKKSLANNQSTQKSVNLNDKTQQQQENEWLGQNQQNFFQLQNYENEDFSSDEENQSKRKNSDQKNKQLKQQQDSQKNSVSQDNQKSKKKKDEKNVQKKSDQKELKEQKEDQEQNKQQQQIQVQIQTPQQSKKKGKQKKEQEKQVQQKEEKSETQSVKSLVTESGSKKNEEQEQEEKKKKKKKKSKKQKSLKQKEEDEINQILDQEKQNVLKEKQIIEEKNRQIQMEKQKLEKEKQIQQQRDQKHKETQFLQRKELRNRQEKLKQSQKIQQAVFSPSNQKKLSHKEQFINISTKQIFEQPDKISELISNFNTNNYISELPSQINQNLSQIYETAKTEIKQQNFVRAINFLQQGLVYLNENHTSYFTFSEVSKFRKDFFKRIAQSYLQINMFREAVLFGHLFYSMKLTSKQKYKANLILGKSYLNINMFREALFHFEQLKAVQEKPEYFVTYGYQLCWDILQNQENLVKNSPLFDYSWNKIKEELNEMRDRDFPWLISQNHQWNTLEDEVKNKHFNLFILISVNLFMDNFYGAVIGVFSNKEDAKQAQSKYINLQQKQNSTIFQKHYYQYQDKKTGNNRSMDILIHTESKEKGKIEGIAAFIQEFYVEDQILTHTPRIKNSIQIYALKQN